MEWVILVNEEDRAVGREEKTAAHVAGLLHRAFSIFVFDPSGRLLLQRRAAGKYHSAGRWSNTCCGHPRPEESLEGAAHRRLREEMGFSCLLTRITAYRYRAILDNGLVENEVDHLLVGEFEGEPSPDPGEAAGWRWVDPGAIRRDALSAPSRYTVWFPGCLEQVLAARRPGRPRP